MRERLTMLRSMVLRNQENLMVPGMLPMYQCLILSNCYKVGVV